VWVPYGVWTFRKSVKHLYVDVYDVVRRQILPVEIPIQFSYTLKSWIHLDRL